jgi:antitoxin component of MazEF toxin-antitoxin module
MVKTLSPIGNSLGLIIDKAILDLLGIARDTPLDIKTDGEALIIRPVRSVEAPVAESTRRMMDAHAETLRKLAK